MTDLTPSLFCKLLFFLHWLARHALVMTGQGHTGHQQELQALVLDAPRVWRCPHAAAAAVQLATHVHQCFQLQVGVSLPL